MFPTDSQFRDSVSTDKYCITNARDSGSTVKIHYADPRFSNASYENAPEGSAASPRGSVQNLHGSFGYSRLSTASDNTVRPNEDTRSSVGPNDAQRSEDTDEQVAMIVEGQNSDSHFPESPVLGNFDNLSLVSDTNSGVSAPFGLRQIRKDRPPPTPSLLPKIIPGDLRPSQKVKAEVQFDQIASYLSKACTDTGRAIMQASGRFEGYLEATSSHGAPLQIQLHWLDFISRCKICLSAGEALKEQLSMQRQYMIYLNSFWRLTWLFLDSYDELESKVSNVTDSVTPVLLNPATLSCRQARKIISQSTWWRGDELPEIPSISVPGGLPRASNARKQLLLHGKATIMATQLSQFGQEGPCEVQPSMKHDIISMPYSINVTIVYRGAYHKMIVAKEISYRDLVDRADSKLSRLTSKTISSGSLRMSYWDVNDNYCLIDSERTKEDAFLDWWGAASQEVVRAGDWSPYRDMLLFVHEALSPGHLQRH